MSSRRLAVSKFVFVLCFSFFFEDFVQHDHVQVRLIHSFLFFPSLVRLIALRCVLFAFHLISSLFMSFHLFASHIIFTQAWRCGATATAMHCTVAVRSFVVGILSSVLFCSMRSPLGFALLCYVCSAYCICVVLYRRVNCTCPLHCIALHFSSYSLSSMLCCAAVPFGEK